VGTNHARSEATSIVPGVGWLSGPCFANGKVPRARKRVAASSKQQILNEPEYSMGAWEGNTLWKRTGTLP